MDPFRLSVAVLLAGGFLAGFLDVAKIRLVFDVRELRKKIRENKGIRVDRLVPGVRDDVALLRSG